MSRPKKQPIRPIEPEPEPEPSLYRLQVFGGIDQALARLCLRDPRPKKEIAEAAGINASMLSGFCSGRRIPTLEHLDRLLTALGVGIEELTYELRTVDYHKEPATLVPRARKLSSGWYQLDEAAMGTMMSIITKYFEEHSADSSPARAGSKKPQPDQPQRGAGRAAKKAR